jgi:hypothetical protein
MHLFPVSAAVVLALFQGCPSNNPPVIAPENVVPVAVTLERTVCFGACPAYTVSMDTNGNVVYVGKQFVTETGTRNAHVEASVVQAISRAADASWFYGLDSVYDASVTDCPWAYVTVTASALVPKTVRDYQCAQAPAALRRLEVLIDSLLDTHRWTGK